jgi:hypothetical protein
MVVVFSITPASTLENKSQTELYTENIRKRLKLGGHVYDCSSV